MVSRPKREVCQTCKNYIESKTAQGKVERKQLTSDCLELEKFRSPMILAITKDIHCQVFQFKLSRAFKT